VEGNKPEQGHESDRPPSDGASSDRACMYKVHAADKDTGGGTHALEICIKIQF
jgi:hypothetical protein